MDEFPEQMETPPNQSNANLKSLDEIIETQDDDDDELMDHSDDSDSDDDIENYTSKFTNNMYSSYIQQHHPECLHINYDEMETLTNVVRNENGIIIDDLHKTNPILTKYEYTRILGQRAMQIENGSPPYINVESNVIDGYTIAIKEIQQKKIPIIIRRPIGNTFEYWKLQDLEILM
jgi:DNA-directed RNA polymerase subunit K/omega